MHFANIIISGTQNIISGSGITHLPVMLLPSILDLVLKIFYEWTTYLLYDDPLSGLWFQK